MRDKAIKLLTDKGLITDEDVVATVFIDGRCFAVASDGMDAAISCTEDGAVVYLPPLVVELIRRLTK